MGLTVSLDGSDGVANVIGPDITSLTITMPSGVQDVTGVNSSAMERILLLADLQITFNGVFNDAADLSHATFKDYRTNTGSELGRTLTLAHSGQTLSEPALLLTNYDLTRSQDGSLVWT